MLRIAPIARDQKYNWKRKEQMKHNLLCMDVSLPTCAFCWKSKRKGSCCPLKGRRSFVGWVGNCPPRYSRTKNIENCTIVSRKFSFLPLAHPLPLPICTGIFQFSTLKYRFWWTGFFSQFENNWIFFPVQTDFFFKFHG